MTTPRGTPATRVTWKPTPPSPDHVLRPADRERGQRASGGPAVPRANVCYLLGPVAETLAYRLLGEDLLPVGPALYRMGLTFSVGLALFPALLVTLVLLVKPFLLPW